MTLLTHTDADSSIPGEEQFTPEQLHFLEVSRKRAVRDALRKYIPGALIGYLILLAGLIFAWNERDQQTAARRADNVAARHQIVNTGNAVAVSGCNRDFESATKLRALIAAGRPQIKQYVKDGTLTPAQGDRALANIDAQLRTYALPDCRKVAHVVTDNPDRYVTIPAPKHP